MKQIWSDGIDSNFYKKYYILIDPELAVIFPRKSVWGFMKCESFEIVTNELAKLKTDENHKIAQTLLKLAYDNPIKVIYEKLSWIGKSSEKLLMETGQYSAEKEDELKKLLETIQDVNLDQLKSIKERIVEDYSDILPQVDFSNSGSISNTKLGIICNKFGLHFVSSRKDKKVGGTRYSVVHMVKEEGEDGKE